MKGGPALGGLALAIPALGAGALLTLGVLAAGGEPQQAGLATGTVPEAYAPLLEQHGSRCAAVDPALLAAQAKAESGFNPHAVSPAGAQGLSQFMPATWAAHGVDGDGDGAADPQNPADAIASQAEYDCYLADLVSEVPGDPTENMLAAYNAGPYAVLQYQGVPPYEETQGYVERIQRFREQLAAPVTEVAQVDGPAGMHQRVVYHGAQMDAVTMAALQEVERRLGYQLVVTQGSFSTGVDASGGTHDGAGVLDLAVGADPDGVVLVMRQTGWFAWHRTPAQGPWEEHIHAGLLGHPGLSEAAKVQQESYLRGDNGLVGDVADDGPRVQPVVFSWPAP